MKFRKNRVAAFALDSGYRHSHCTSRGGSLRVWGPLPSEGKPWPGHDLCHHEHTMPRYSNSALGRREGQSNGKDRVVVEKPASWSSRASQMRCIACSELVGTTDTSRLTSAHSGSSLGLSSSAVPPHQQSSAWHRLMRAAPYTTFRVHLITATSSRVVPVGLSEAVSPTPAALLPLLQECMAWHILKPGLSLSR